jgi:hypothetical protein
MGNVIMEDHSHSLSKRKREREILKKKEIIEKIVDSPTIDPK